MEKFEYRTFIYDTEGWMGGKVDNRDFEMELNKLGLDGWELVSSVSTNHSYGQTRSIVSIFKRKIRRAE